MPPQERNVGYLFQNYALFPTITVEKNIGIALRCGKKEKEKKVRDMIDRFSLQGLEKKTSGAVVRRPAAADGACEDHDL